VTLVAKEMYLTAQWNGFENVDWEMQSPDYQNEGVCCLLYQQLSPDVERNI
jgi:hypothetical protein